MIRGVTGWGETRQRTPSNAAGERVIAANVATAPMHRLNRAMVMSLVPEGARGQEQPGADLRVGQPAGGQPGDLRLPRGQLDRPPSLSSARDRASTPAPNSHSPADPTDVQVGVFKVIVNGQVTHPAEITVDQQRGGQASMAVSSLLPVGY
jgi:hypothetical protein